MTNSITSALKAHNQMRMCPSQIKQITSVMTGGAEAARLSISGPEERASSGGRIAPELLREHVRSE